MTAAVDGPTEPEVLAGAKRRLFPEDEPDGYAVADTQFASDRWLADGRIDPAVKRALAPFNHVRLGSGYPDLVGVRALGDDLLAVDRLDDDPPLVAVEAKGHAIDGRVDGRVDPLERPRVVGNRTTTEAAAIRFQASAQGVADRSFGLNHPKNYLAYPLAHAHGDDTATVLAERVVGAVDDALGAFEAWKRSRRRFRDLAPRWGLLARRVLFAYPATQLLVEELQRMHDDGIAAPTLVDLVEYLHELHPTFAVELFVRGTDGARSRVLGPGGDLRRGALADGEVYHAPTTFQLKAMLFHAGVLTERGAEPSDLDPADDVWRLRHPVPG